LERCIRCDEPIVGRGLQRLCLDCNVDWKWCASCETLKPIDAFRIPNGRRIGYCYDCLLRKNKEQYATNQHTRDYHYVQHLRRKLGISKEHAEQLAAARECEICGRPAKKRLHVDHNHGTGQVRGAVCVQCNHALAVLEADPDWLAQMLDYLERWEIERDA
jgi:hypothetical protein